MIGAKSRDAPRRARPKAELNSVTIFVHVIYMTRLCQGVEVSFDIYNTESVSSAEFLTQDGLEAF